MATVNVAYFIPDQYKAYAVIGPNRRIETFTSSGVSQAGTLIARKNEICLIGVTGGSIYVATGENPTATANDLLVINDTSISLYLPEGHKVAIIDVV